MEGMDRYRRDSEIRRMRLVLDNAILLVSAARPGQPNAAGYTEEDFERARNELQEFANPTSIISNIMPATLGGQKDTITKILELYPKPESSEYMIKLLTVLREF